VTGENAMIDPDERKEIKTRNVRNFYRGRGGGLEAVFCREVTWTNGRTHSLFQCHFFTTKR